jgi:hypothetical protein
VTVDDSEKLEFLARARSLIHQADEWADSKLESGVPASAREAESIDKILAMLAQLKRSVAEWKADLPKANDPDA